MKFQINEGPIDRLLRLVLGSVLLGAVVAGWVSAPLIYVFLVLAAIGLITGVTGFCVAYVPFGFSTRSPAHE